MTDPIDGLNELLKELTTERDQIERQRGNLDFAIERIKRKISAILGRDTLENVHQWNVQLGKKVTITALSKQILREHPSGLPLPALISELRKHGYEPKAKNVPNTVNSVLHKAGLPFNRGPDGRWTLANDISSSLPGSDNDQEETSVH